MAFCPNCGTQVEPGKPFCPNCGSPLQAQAAPQQPQYNNAQPQYNNAQPQYGNQPSMNQAYSQQSNYNNAQPQYGIQLPPAQPGPDFLTSWKLFWSNYANFTGRSRRCEFWWASLANCLIGFAMQILLLASGGNAFYKVLSGHSAGSAGFIFSLMLIIISLYGLATLVPNIAITVRRLHDQGKSGLWALALLLLIIPILNFAVAIAYIVFMCLDSTPGPNKWGQSPKYPM